MTLFFRKSNTLFLIMVLIFSPLQMSYASVMTCSDSAAMHQHKNYLSKNHDQNIAILNDKTKDCCQQNQCTLAQCVASVVATLSTLILASNSNTAINMATTFDKTFVNYFNSSIYRPPRSPIV